MQIKIDQEESGQLLKVGGALDIEAAQELQEVLRESIAANLSLILDLREVDACDTAALQVLYSARKTADLTNKPLRVLGVSAAVAEAAAVLGLDLQELTGEGSSTP